MKLPHIDILSPIETWIARSRHGNLVRIKIARTSTWNGMRIEKLLRQYGIPVWGRKISDNCRSFLVKEKQAEWAEYILLRADAPITSTLRNPQNAQHAKKYAPGDMPTPWQPKGIRPKSFIAVIGDLFSGK